MYIIFGTVIVLLIFLFGSTLLSMIKNYVTNSSPTVKIGNVWFVGLLLINVIIIIFICGFYYYKSNEIGQHGLTGDKGFAGYEGETCIITKC